MVFVKEIVMEGLKEDRKQSSSGRDKLDLRPGQILGPPPNATCLPEDFNVCSHRSGLNSSASSPQSSLSRCKTQNINATVWPFATNIGDLPSGPPPTGRVVSRLATRSMMGIVGMRRSAVLG